MKEYRYKEGLIGGLSGGLGPLFGVPIGFYIAEAAGVDSIVYIALICSLLACFFGHLIMKILFKLWK
ncbi:hypothetical protein [Capillibacterium thermochitinicola]|uniref:Uncharacterized protein n=1 Tax=Capillibacterium thermochitinicola TaxID=2699427 RepID=A0A8J6LJN6_9FIRM|nr:hypothetical protein [Capillibacterium thermochitinicola]MBA2133955.1 hypothetical protein [Capillibacterium thermochitinicola]